MSHTLRAHNFQLSAKNKYPVPPGLGQSLSANNEKPFAMDKD